MRTTILTILLTLSMFAGIELTKADNSIPNNPEIPIIWSGIQILIIT